MSIKKFKSLLIASMQPHRKSVVQTMDQTNEYISDINTHYHRARYYEFLAKQNSYQSTVNSAVKHNERNAIWCFLYSAIKGHSSAQFQLGQCYLHGHLGLSSNIRSAKKWLQLAANQGHIEARRTLTQLD